MFYVQSKYEWIIKTAEIPILGFFFLAIMSALPGALLTIFTIHFYELSEVQFELIALSLYPFWNLFLIARGVKIFLFFIRADLFWLIFGLLTFVFNVI